MATYKTPDVYVEEISIFPPSVAEVETAIPAFIGYTERATKTVEDDLILKPTRIKSMLEFEKLYGGAPAPSVTSVTLDDSGAFKDSVVATTYYLYDSMRLFYDNGGGDCYIVAVGKYGTTPTLGNDSSGMKGGLKMLEQYDEPTIILFPDAVSLTGTGLYDLQKSTLNQCNALKDRVGVFDLQWDDPNGAEFRDNIGINYLKYGMAYTPWLKVTLAKNVRYKDIRTKILKGVAASSLKLFAPSTAVNAAIENYDALLNDKAKIESEVDTLYGSATTLRMRFNQVIGEYEASKTAATFGAVMQFLFDISKDVDNWAVDSTNSELTASIGSLIASDFMPAYSKLIVYDLTTADTIAGYTADNGGYDETDNTHASWKSGANNIFKAGTLAVDAALKTELTALANDDLRTDTVLGKVKTLFESINDAFAGLLQTLGSTETMYENLLLDAFPLYKDIISGINNEATVMPPSGAMAGVYAAVDRDRGVWKAPANVSLNSVVGPDTIFAASELDALNIDVNAGKSINAIRAFSGKGTLVWGARTLAGNDNEWRYIPVRRFYNTVEESIKKSTYWAVFEPNNANTWLKVKGMIESYLTNKWKEGALAGAKPDEAFFVRIGLGQTMSADDILNGYMKVEIGMAVVRPAEFIVLKFSHKLQQS